MNVSHLVSLKQSLFKTKQNGSNGPGLEKQPVFIEDIRLANDKFLFIMDNPTSYGGNQQWYQGRKERIGCGPVVGANISYYLARENSSKYGKLYTPEGFSQQEFAVHMESLYKHMKPGVFGMTSLFDFSAKMESFASSRGVPLSRVMNRSPFTLDHTAMYIKEGLLSDSPVAALNLKWPKTGYPYGWHWMTITGYSQDAFDNRWITVSTWGEKRMIDYRAYFQAIRWFGGGLMYFN